MTWYPIDAYNLVQSQVASHTEKKLKSCLFFTRGIAIFQEKRAYYLSPPPPLKSLEGGRAFNMEKPEKYIKM